MKPYIRLAIIFTLSFGIAIAILRTVPKQRPISSSGSVSLYETLPKDLKIIDWRVLLGLNYRSGQAEPSVKVLDGKEVRIPGFMVPLDDYQNRVSEFLLVPSPQACIHVPPPPPNQMIYVTMKDKTEIDVAFGAIWVEGELKLTKVESPYGSVAYQLIGKAIRPYVFERPHNL